MSPRTDPTPAKILRETRDRRSQGPYRKKAYTCGCGKPAVDLRSDPHGYAGGECARAQHHHTQPASHRAQYMRALPEANANEMGDTPGERHMSA
jgi:hypothetical protein